MVKASELPTAAPQTNPVDFQLEKLQGVNSSTADLCPAPLLGHDFLKTQNIYSSFSPKGKMILNWGT